MKKYTVTTSVLFGGLSLYSSVALAQVPPPPVNVANQSAPLGIGVIPLVIPKNLGQNSSTTLVSPQGVSGGINAPSSTLQNKIGQTASTTLKNFPQGVPLSAAVATSAPPVLKPVYTAAPLKQPNNLPVQSSTSTMKVYQSPPEELASTTPVTQPEKKGFFAKIIEFFKNLFSGKK